VTVHVLWCVLEVAIAGIVVLYVIDWYCLKASPAQRNNQGVLGLENSIMPPVLLQAHSNTANIGFVRD